MVIQQRFAPFYATRTVPLLIDRIFDKIHCASNRLLRNCPPCNRPATGLRTPLSTPMNEMTEPNQPNQNLLDALIADPMLAVSEFYASCLAAHPRATEFVRQELGLDAAQASERRIGFADRSLGTQIPSRRIRRGREVRDRLLASGLYKGNGRETLRGRVTEPMLDEAGRLIGLRGYPIDPHAGGEAVVVVLAASGTATDQKPEVEASQVDQESHLEDAVV